jgi:hypothetical protein
LAWRCLSRRRTSNLSHHRQQPLLGLQHLLGLLQLLMGLLPLLGLQSQVLQAV